MAAQILATFASLGTRLATPGTPPEDILKTVTEIKERVEVVHTAEYPRWLEAVLPPLLQQLTTHTTPQLQEGTIHRCVSGCAGDGAMVQTP